jgi:hypothetical protein
VLTATYTIANATTSTTARMATVDLRSMGANLTSGAH